MPRDIFALTEATFGLPVFRHPPTADEIAKLIGAVRAEPDRSVLVGAYALGKAQRVIAELRGAGWDAPIYIHGALEKIAPALCCAWRRSWRTAARFGNRQGRYGGADYSSAALGAQRPLVAAVARSGDCDGVGLDARAAARAVSGWSNCRWSFRTTPIRTS